MMAGSRGIQEQALMIDLNCLPSKRVIFVGSGQNHEDSGVDLELSRKVVLALAYLDAEKENPITLIINCCGGDEYHCISIYDAIKNCRSYVRAIVCGHACSAAAIFLQAADERLMTANSWLMIHNGSFEFGHDIVESVKQEYRQLNRILKQCQDMLNAKAKLPDKQLQSLLKKDTWLTAEEAVQLGLVDKIIDDWHEHIGNK